MEVRVRLAPQVSAWGPPGDRGFCPWKRAGKKRTDHAISITYLFDRAISVEWLNIETLEISTAFSIRLRLRVILKVPSQPN